MSPLLRTALNATHRELGARLVEFAGWEMPIQYAGILAEHRAVRTSVGLFDVSHMGRIAVRGSAAAALLDRLVTSDIAALRPGRARYGLLCDENGGILDDLVTFRLDADDFLVVCNAGSWDRVMGWLTGKAQGRAVEIVPRRDGTAMLALQGPDAPAAAGPLCEADITGLGRFGVVQTKVGGVPAIVSRTGYTGEDGYEFVVEAQSALQLWQSLLERSIPCGLGARDTLRLEAGLLLYGQDMGTATTPLEAGLERFVALEKEFIGAEALREQARQGLARRLVAFVLESRTAPRHGYPVYLEDRLAGTVTSGSFSPTLEKGIGLVYLPPPATPGTALCVDVRGRLECGAVVELPFFRRRG